MGPSYFVRGDGHIDAAYSAVRVAAAASAGMQAGHRYAKINGITQPTAEVVNVCAETAGRLVALRPGPLETKAALRIQALVRATMARNNTRRGKAAQLRFAKLSVFDFLQAMVDVWEEARLNTEEKLVSMFMLGDQNGDGALDYSEFEPLAREFAQLLGQVDVSEHRIRNMFMYMLQESSNDTGAIAMDVFVSTMAGSLYSSGSTRAIPCTKVVCFLQTLQTITRRRRRPR